MHFMLRYSDKITGVDTLGEHQKVLNKKGAVWLGKFGVGAAKHIVNIAMKKINNNEECYLYLVNGSVFTYKARVLDIFLDETGIGSNAPDKSMVPSYYQNRKCTIWFKICDMSKFDDDEFKSLWLFNDPGMHPKTNGMRGLIYLTKLEKKIVEIKKEYNYLYDAPLFDD